jgi:hypothetical protein
MIDPTKLILQYQKMNRIYRFIGTASFDPYLYNPWEDAGSFRLDIISTRYFHTHSLQRPPQNPV